MSRFADACLGKRDLQPIYALLHFSLAPTDSDLGLRLWLCQQGQQLLFLPWRTLLWDTWLFCG